MDIANEQFIAGTYERNGQATKQPRCIPQVYLLLENRDLQIIYYYVERVCHTCERMLLLSWRCDYEDRLM